MSFFMGFTRRQGYFSSVSVKHCVLTLCFWLSVVNCGFGQGRLLGTICLFFCLYCSLNCFRVQTPSKCHVFSSSVNSLGISDELKQKLQDVMVDRHKLTLGKTLGEGTALFSIFLFLLLGQPVVNNHRGKVWQTAVKSALTNTFLSGPVHSTKTLICHSTAVCWSLIFCDANTFWPRVCSIITVCSVICLQFSSVHTQENHCSSLLNKTCNVFASKTAFELAVCVLISFFRGVWLGDGGAADSGGVCSQSCCQDYEEWVDSKSTQLSPQWIPSCWEHRAFDRQSPHGSKSCVKISHFDQKMDKDAACKKYWQRRKLTPNVL